MSGMTIDSDGTTEIRDNRDVNGNGDVTYIAYCNDGTFWLSKDELWGDGVNDITGWFTYFKVVATVTYASWNRVGATWNITATGVFENCRMRYNVMEFALASATEVWHPDDGGSMPSDYPPLLCDASTGEALYLCCVTMSFQPATPVEESSWGVIKGFYR
jgi:hypothetical protein